MSKTELQKLLTSKSGTLQVNKYCTLVRWHEDAGENSIDRLQAIFSIGGYGDYITEIYARSISGVMEEMIAAREKAFDAAADKYKERIIH